MRKESFPVTLYRDEDGWYVVECPIIPGCMSQGKTEPEALHNIREAIQLCLEVRREQGLPHTLSIPLHDELDRVSCVTRFAKLA